MVYVRSQKFCCCIPVRFGVFVMSFLGIVGGVFLSFLFWSACFQIKNKALTLQKHEEIILFVSTALYTLYTLVSLFGFIGCLVRRRILVQIYAGVSWTMLLVSIITGSIFLWGLFHTDPEKAYQGCIQTNIDSTGELQSLQQDICRKTSQVFATASRVGITIGFVVFWLLMIYACHVIQSYVSQLEEEEDAYGRNRGRSSTPTTTTSVNVMPVVASPLPTTYGQPYPFTQPPNSYGK